MSIQRMPEEGARGSRAGDALVASSVVARQIRHCGCSAGSRCSACGAITRSAAHSTTLDAIMTKSPKDGAPPPDDEDSEREDSDPGDVEEGDGGEPEYHHGG